MEYRRSVEEAQRRVEEAPAPGPAPEPVKPAVSAVEPARPQAQAIMVEDAGLEWSEAGDAGGGKSPVELVIERAASMLMDAERNMLMNIPPEIVERFISDAEGLGWKKSAAKTSWSMPEEYMRYGLLEDVGGGRLKATPIGRALINAAQSITPLRGAGRG